MSESRIQTAGGTFNREERVVPAWKIIGHTITAIPDVFYPFDPHVLKAIHEFDRNVIPLWVRITYQAATGGRKTFGWHAIGSHRYNRHYALPTWFYKLAMPKSGSVLKPTHIDLHIKDANRPKGNGLPGYGAYIPADWRVYKLLRGMYGEWTQKEATAAFQVQQDTLAKAREDAEARADYAVKHTERQMRRHFEGIDADDIQRIIAKGMESPKPTPTIVVP